MDRITAPAQPAHTGKVLKMVHNPRMGGSVPAWVEASSAKDEIARNLAQAGRPDASFKAALSYQMQEPSKPSSEFGFFDLLDMVNPLQHIPIVNLAYRRLTGDEIKDVPQIIGGAIFGGPVGAATGLANVIIQEETGRDIASNALAMVSGDMPSFREHKQNQKLSDHPEKRLQDALTGAPPLEDLPVSLLAFADTRSTWRAERRADDLEPGFSPYEIY